MADLGQVFTKSNVAHYMASLFDLPKQAAIMDPCFGGGSFLDALLGHGYSNVTACEIDARLFEEAKGKYRQYRLINMDFLKYAGHGAYDGIIMNPPYIKQQKIDGLWPYGVTKRALRANPIFSGLPGTANMYMYFIMKAIDLLKDGGQLVVIFPCSWMGARGGGKFQEAMLSKCGMEKRVYIHGDVFEREAQVDVAILKLIKGRMGLNTAEGHLESKNGGLQSAPPQTGKAFEGFAYPFVKLATVKRGLTTGCNEMYINPSIPHDCDGCLKPIISSPKSINGYTTLNARLDRLLCPVKGLVPDGVSDYLGFWENKITQRQKPKALYLKALSSDKWYEVREISGEGILFSYFVRSDMKFVMNEAGALVRDNFYIIRPKIDKWAMLALLNNHYTYYQLELRGKRLGAGLLKLQKYDIEGLCFPDYGMVSGPDKEMLAALAHKLVRGGDALTVGEITKLASKYSKVGYEEIMGMHAAIKSGRLGGG